MSIPEQDIPADQPATQAAKPQRVLSCMLCQQRKVKCQRNFPCDNCIKSRAQCIPAATVSRQRRRRFPERDLLDRLRYYESLLRKNNIKFEPLHQDSSITKQRPLKRDDEDCGSGSPDHDQQSANSTTADPSSCPLTAAKSDIVYEPRSLWHAMNQEQQVGLPRYHKPTLTAKGSTRDLDDDDSSSFLSKDVHEAAIKDVWNGLYQNNDHLLFGSRETPVDISTLHPEQVQIFKLWHIYIDNVNPLLKVIHTPTLQGRIIDAASDIASTDPNLAALMFSIYCVSTLSLGEDECLTMFGSPKQRILARFQFGCQQALLNCGFLRSSDRDCLTALYLYLISVRPATVPQSLSSMLGVAIRIAQRMELHNESACARYPALEAEMRRRLWWSLVLFDNRVCELADNKTTMLAPTWDCKTPLNLNDFDLRPEMKNLPAPQEKSSETIFAVVRSEMGDFVRHSAFHLDFVSPALKVVAKDVQRGHGPEGGELFKLEEMIENNHLKFCNSENPLHFVTIWTARGYLAKSRLLEHYSRLPTVPLQQTDAQRDAGIKHALSMLECDTKLMTCTLIKGYLWFIQFHFPFPAYIHLVQELRVRPLSTLAERAWEVMSDNYEARFKGLGQDDHKIFRLFTKIILQAWEAREVAFKQINKPLVPPRVVADINHKASQIIHNTYASGMNQLKDTSGSDRDIPMPMLMDYGCHSLLHGVEGQSYSGIDSTLFHHMPSDTALDVDSNDLDWTSVNWNPLYSSNW